MCSWIKETEKSLVTFQSLEEDRLAHIRDSLWRVANISSLAAVADDLAAEEVRKTLEISELDDAIQGTFKQVMAIPVVEFSREGDKIRKNFG